jgi:excinuclease ABC subunit C
MVTIAHTVTYQVTESVLEALLLESKFIKDTIPLYNTKEKDNKSFSCVVITKEKFPRVLVMRIRDYEKRFAKKDVQEVYGPFASLQQLRDALKIIRRLFPFRDRCEVGMGAFGEKKCFNAQLGLCPGVCIGAITESEYKRHITNIKNLFNGKRIEIKKDLEKDMKEYAKKELFEKAAKVRNTLFAFDHIKDISLIRDDAITSFKDINFRIVAHISGTSRVGVMTVIEGKEKAQGEYRKFKLPESINDDYEGLREIMVRRFSHKEWRFPDLIVIDGGVAHKQTAEKVLAHLNLSIPCVSVVKDERHKPKDILGDKVHVDYHKKEILLSNAEAHRFAITYHKTLRDKVH